MSWHSDNIKKEKHCFFGAEGGVSKGIYSSLNVNTMSGDKRENIRRNLNIIAQSFGLEYQNMMLLKQGVSDIAVFVENPTQYEVWADGAVTKNHNVLLCLKTADCAPVLLADYKNSVIGIAHAGWRGAYKGIVQNVAKLMFEHGARPEDIAAAIGPCMQQQSFAVKDDMRQELLQATSAAERYFIADTDGEHFYFDLSGYVEAQLKSIGISDIENCRIDTYPPQNGYFSYRRNTHLNLIEAPKDYPTQYSCICL
jgi:YfiH family protein